MSYQIEKITMQSSLSFLKLSISILEKKYIHEKQTQKRSQKNLLILKNINLALGIINKCKNTLTKALIEIDKEDSDYDLIRTYVNEINKQLQLIKPVYSVN